jgi:hypothetical protein
MDGTKMRAFIFIAVLLCIVPSVRAQEASASVIMKPDMYDSWGDISFENEQTHLDRIATQAREWSLSIVHLVVHAGKIACVGEAKARGLRARDYLISKGIEPERVEWIDAGWRKQAGVEVWIWPLQFGKPESNVEENLKRNKIRFERNCKIKQRG